MPYNFLYLLFYIISKQLYTHPWMINSFRKPSQINPTLCFPNQVLTVLSTSLFKAYWCPQRSSLNFGSTWKLLGTKFGLVEGCSRMVWFNLSIASIVACEVCGLAVPFCIKTFSLFLQIPVNCSFKVLSVSMYHPQLSTVPGWRKYTWPTPYASPPPPPKVPYVFPTLC
jgi:hypothetical protein